MPAVRVQGGWMVPYDESIPGTTVSFRMMPVPGGTFRMGSTSVEDGRTADEGPVFEVTVQPCWMGRCEGTWAEYRRYMEACDLFTALQSSGLWRSGTSGSSAMPPHSGHASDDHATGGCGDANQKPRSHDTSRIAWAKLMARVGEKFPLECPACGGDIRLRGDCRQEPAHAK